MAKVRARLLALVALLPSSLVIGAEIVSLTCEQWHPRRGQVADKSYAIDVAAKSCNGQPCAISDSQLKWTEQNGRYEVAINRTSGDGTVVYMGELLMSYKSCKPAAGKS